MISSVLNEEVQKILYFGQDSVFLLLKTFIQTMKMSFQDVRLLAWIVLLSRKQNCLTTFP